MSDTTDPSRRAAAGPTTSHEGPVTLINSFVVAPDRDDAFQEIWTTTSGYFRAQPGFVNLRMHKALSPDANYRYVNVAVWASAGDFARAHQTEQFRRLMNAPALKEFPSRPALYEVFAAH